MSTRRGNRSFERGAVIIQMAVVLLGLMAFSALVVDYGIMWTARGQAQTAADAGALAGAITLGYDSPTDFAGARLKAQAAARANFVWGQAPDVQPTDVTFLTPATCRPPAYPGLPDTCVKVDVYRNQARANGLPILFGTLVGVAGQGVRATATAQVINGSATDCLKPWAVVDRWTEAAPPSGTDQDPGAFGPMSTYDKYSNGQGNNPPYEPDVYTPPTATDPGTGFRLPYDQGYQFAIKTGAQGQQGPGAISSGWSREIQLPRASGCYTGASCYNDNITSCGGLTYAIATPGQQCPATIGQYDDAVYWAARGCFNVQTGVSQGPTSQGVQDLIARDSNATFNTSTKQIENSAYDPPTRSPRVVPIAAMDIDNYLAQNPQGSTGVARMVNIYGYFIEGMGDVNRNTGAITCCSRNGQAVVGYIISIPGLSFAGSPIVSSASFLNTIILVR
jgi:Flp pilus assembly protein TadG